MYTPHLGPNLRYEFGGREGFLAPKGETSSLVGPVPPARRPKKAFRATDITVRQGLNIARILRDEATIWYLKTERKVATVSMDCGKLLINSTEQQGYFNSLI